MYKRLLGGMLPLTLLAVSSAHGEPGFHALGTAVSVNTPGAALDDKGLAIIEGGQDVSAMLEGILGQASQAVSSALKQANLATNLTFKQAQLVRQLVLQQARIGKPLAPGYKYYFVNGKLMRKEKLPGQNTIIHSVSNNSNQSTIVMSSAQFVHQSSIWMGGK